MRQRILDFLKQNKNKRYTINDLNKALGLKTSEEYKELAKAVNALERDAIVVPDSKNRYSLLEHSNHVTGILDVKDKGFAFLDIDESDEEDIYLPPGNLKDAMDGDRVLVKVDKSPRGFKKEGTVIRILKRQTTHLIGTVVKRGNRHYLISDKKSIKADILITKNGLKGAKPHDKAEAKIVSYAEKNRMVCEITRVIGNMNEPGVDVESKIMKHGVMVDFSEDALKQAKRYKSIDPGAYKGRKDYRDHTIVTIDGADAKDFDDAVEVRRTHEGNYYLGVHIADVSHYVSEDSPLDQDAFERGTSIYLVDRVIPMLPENLSNNLCSLMPGVDRLAMSCEMVINPNGKVLDYDIFESVIRSKARMTYTKVNKILEGDKALRDEYETLTPMFETMNKFAKMLHRKRTEKGSINFETDEPIITLDDNKKAVDVKLAVRGDAEKLIEEFMLKANQVVATHVHKKKLPFIYRVHDTPDEEKVQKLLTMANALGFRVKAEKSITHRDLQKLLQKVEDTAHERGMNMMMLRTMQKAVYSEENIGHFGLAFEHYTHFTSPIRRYPDLIVHRLLKRYFIDKDKRHDTIRHYESIMPDVAERSSSRERTAVTLERDVLDMKKAEYMADKIDETFEGHISGVTAFGIYVGLPNTIEGLVHISALDDDYYVFDENLLTLIGRRKKKTYRMGEPIKVKLTSVNVFDGEINFIPVGGA
ncbi:MAG: ribonuclease R [Bacillota bacterium]